MSFFATTSAISRNGFQSNQVEPLWIKVQSINNNPNATSNFAIFGSAPALSSTGEYIAFALRNTSNTGKVQIYYNGGSGNTWSLQQSITPNVVGDLFGASLSFDDAGNYLAIGASYDNSNRGAAYIYTRSGNTWSQQQKITASDAAASDNFGSSISISANGDVLAVGSPLDDNNALSNNGAVYIYNRTISTWSETQKIVGDAPYRGSNARFGTSLQLSSDANYISIGQPRINSNAGRIFIYKFDSNLGYIQLANLEGSTGSYFGYNTGINNDGTICYGTLQSAFGNPGQARIYKRTGNSFNLINQIIVQVPTQDTDSSAKFSVIQPNGNNFLCSQSDFTSGALALVNQNENYVTTQRIQENSLWIGIASSSNIAMFGPYFGNTSDADIYVKQT